MDVSTHHEYLTYLRQRLVPLLEDPAVTAKLEVYAYEFVTLTKLNLDPLHEALEALYCPTGQGAPKDPVCMLRVLLLMTFRRETSSPDAWAHRLKGDDLLALLTGFEPGQTPCGTALRDFIIRYGDGPYAVRSEQPNTLSQTLQGQHERRLSDTTKARQAEADRQGLSQSEALCRRLLDEVDTPRDPQALQMRLSDLLVQLGLRPTIEGRPVWRRGIHARRGRRRQASKPFIPGITTSNTIRSGKAYATRSNASSPLRATETLLIFGSQFLSMDPKWGPSKLVVHCTYNPVSFSSSISRRC